MTIHQMNEGVLANLKMNSKKEPLVDTYVVDEPKENSKKELSWCGDIIEDDYPEEATEKLDEFFPKGDKRRGQALLILSLAYNENRDKLKEQGRQEQIEKTINWIDKSTKALHKIGEPCCSISYGDKSELCDLHQLKEWLEKQKVKTNG